MNETTVFNDAEDIIPVILPKIKKISLDDPWKWLALGWQDMKVAPYFSVPYGCAFVLVSFLILWGIIDGGMFFLFPLLTTGFFLSAPILGIGLYGISRSIEKQEKIEFCQIKKSWLSNPVHISAVGLILMMIMLFWMFAAILVFVIFFNNPTLNWEYFFTEVFFSGENNLFLGVGIAIGGLIALFTFSISVITVPLLMDRQIDFMTAMRTSVNAVKENPKALLLWAYLIAVMVGISFLTYFIGLAIAMPVIGHATWHAYRDLVEEEC
ncbi:DUF2189 domain-containing protein [sulfur-oxidizing endosymbiont of Gigantopelta aegis]|uniref:DUF2189 domain-containing protein n=1 Tax=sulfur-oxidizing endosymbiont of Gigantopelta aegis TaxID=2794934 RepID=UPI0018DD0FC1|nr:DUF2189 domain-containing protein [sulfur-oxidizing endosymbiont of Gigantopelta aegis]